MFQEALDVTRHLDNHRLRDHTRYTGISLSYTKIYKAQVQPTVIAGQGWGINNMSVEVKLTLYFIRK